MSHPNGELLVDKGFILVHGGTQQFYEKKKEAIAAAEKMHDIDPLGTAPFYIYKATRLAVENHLQNWRNSQSR
jgi:hypothetical protein